METTYKVVFTQLEKEILVKDIFENFPEYAVRAFYCDSYDYENFIYEFTDDETNIPYTVTLETAVKGFELFLDAVLSGKIDFYGLPTDKASLLDGCNYDVNSLDAILQFSTLGELIYG